MPVIAPGAPFHQYHSPRRGHFSIAFIKKEYPMPGGRFAAWRILPNSTSSAPATLRPAARHQDTAGPQWEALAARPDMTRSSSSVALDDLNAWGNYRYWPQRRKPARKMPGEARLLASGEHMLLRRSGTDAEGERYSGQIFGQLEDGTFLQYRKAGTAG